MPAITLCAASDLCADAIARLLHACDERARDWDPAWDKTQALDEYAEYVRARLRTPGGWVGVAELDGAVVGVVGFEPADQVAYLRMLYVHPAHWRGGIATQLLEAACAEMRARGYSSACLWAIARDPRACGFYDHAGWHTGSARRVHERLGEEMVRYEIEL